MKTNKHQNHIASCHCCIKLNADFEGDYSELTPGRGYYIDCLAGHFYSLEEDEYHEKLVVFARTCPDFKAKD